MAQAKLQVQMMEEARNQASFDSSKLAEIIYGSKEVFDRTVAAFYRVEQATGTGDASKLPSVYGDIDRQKMLLHGLRNGKITFDDGYYNNDYDIFHYISHFLAFGNSNALGLTLFLFIPLLKLHGSDEQVMYWLPQAESGKIIGSYAQTELGHGTDVGGIETTATFDNKTDEFVIQSPSTASAKYWPGGIGFSASHTILMARLIIGDKDRGVHAFMVQLRSPTDFKPVAGIELGDIGLKMSYNGTDNGYAVFNHIRIPRTNLLMRYSTVSRDGTYSAVPFRDKLVYGGLLKGRSILIRSSAFQLAQALTIATRYSTVRLQGNKLSPSSTGTPIIAYKQQHSRLLTLISKSYAIVFTSHSIAKIYPALAHLQQQGNHSTLPFVHMLMCGLKAWTSQTAADGAEEARKMCGGHGYMALSGLPDIVGSVTATCTVEGENFVMWGQVARYLVKGMDCSVLPQDMAYMGSFSHQITPSGITASGNEFLSHEVLLDLFKQRAASLTYEAHGLVKEEEKKGGSRELALDAHALPLLVAGRAHIEVFILQSCIEQLSLLLDTTPPTIVTVLRCLISLFSLSTIASPLAPFTSSFRASTTQLSQMRTLIRGLEERLLPDAIALTDAWSFTDGCLRSAIGCKDGDAYRRIMEWTRQLPINVEAADNGGVFKKGWEEVIKDFIRPDLSFKAKM